MKYSIVISNKWSSIVISNKCVWSGVKLWWFMVIEKYIVNTTSYKAPLLDVIGLIFLRPIRYDIKILGNIFVSLVPSFSVRNHINYWLFWQIWLIWLIDLIWFHFTFLTVVFYLVFIRNLRFFNIFQSFIYFILSIQQGFFPKWQLSKFAISQAATSNVWASRIAPTSSMF